MDIFILLQIQQRRSRRHLRAVMMWGELFCCATAHALREAWRYQRQPIWHPEKQIKKKKEHFRFVPFIDIYGPWR